jgi:hypothetical protein
LKIVGRTLICSRYSWQKMFLIVYSFQRKHRDRLPFNISNMKEKHGFKGNYLIAKSKSETSLWVDNGTVNVVNNKASFICTLYIYIYLYIVTVWYLAKCMTRRHFFRLKQCSLKALIAPWYHGAILWNFIIECIRAMVL